MTKAQYLNKAKELMGFDNKDKILYLSFFGSKLYGTDTEKSDTDLKGIFLPSKDSCFMLNAVKQYTSESKEGQNTKDDIDVTLYSVQYFLELLSTGDTGAMDLFFSIYSNKTIIHQEPEFVELLKINKPYLITKNPAAFFGYIMGQVSSYGIRGSRYGDLLKLRKSIEEFRNIQWEMPTHIEEYVNSVYYTKEEFKYVTIVEKPEHKYLSVCGKLYPFNRLLDLLIPDVDKLIEGYGERAKKANRDGGIDWKAVSHAYRVIFQLTELCETGTITFPLSCALQVKKIKLCKYDHQLSLILDDIADNITIVESLLSASTLPERVDSDVIKCIVTLSYKRF
jgi:hypothetical protein